MLYILSYTLPNASFNCKVLTNFLYLNKLFLVLFIMLTDIITINKIWFNIKERGNEIILRKHFCVCSRPVALIRLRSPAHPACAFRLLSNTLSRVFATDCLQSTNKKKPPFQVTFFVCGRGNEIRTRDILVPNQALYQAELCPVDRFSYYNIFFYIASTFLNFSFFG